MPALGENGPAHVVYANPEQQSVFITPRGDPIVPSEVTRELAQLSPRIKVEWVNGAWGTSSFVVKLQWPEGDKRWERVQTGELDPAQAFDIEQRFPREISTGEMVAWLRNRWGERNRPRNPKAEAERLIAEAQKLMQEADAQAVDTAVETGTQRILDESDHTRLVRGGFERAHPMVNGADFSASPSTDREPKRLIAVADAP